MQVITTHHDLFRCLHGQTCKGNHHHQPIEGSVTTPSGTMLRTKHTEIYPRKFARTVAKVLYKARHSWPFQWKQGMSLLAEGLQQPALASQSRVIKSIKPRGATNFPRLQLVTPVRTDEGVPKRRRLEGKQGHSMSMAFKTCCVNSRIWYLE